jgi:hypothetical protein
MGSIGKYILRTTLASLAPIPVSVAAALRTIPVLAIGESGARLLGWPPTA